MKEYVLLTGATGLLGRYLMRDLLALGHRVAVLIRPGKEQSAQERMEQIMQRWEREQGETLHRPICLSGDIVDPEVTDEATRRWIADHCDSIMHSAASLQFVADKVEPWRTNVEGTKNVLELCHETSIKNMHYISTAYVCGTHKGPVMESGLPAQTEFRNDYEKSKHSAEEMVREHPWTSLTVYRPVVITGDSETGYTSTYHGTYLYMKMTAVVCQHIEPDENGLRHIPIRWGITGEERRNITPVNWNSDVICHLFSNPEAHGRTYHMAPDDPITMREAMALANDFYGVSGVEFLGFGKDISQLDPPMTDFEKSLWSSISIYGDYDFADPEFDTSNLAKFAGHLPCPRLDRTVGERLLKYAENDRWGKRREPKPEPAPADVDELIRSLTEETTLSPHDESVSKLGLNVLGPGGGQWTLMRQGEQIVDFDRGIDSNSEIVEFDSSELVGADAEATLSERINRQTSHPASTQTP